MVRTHAPVLLLTLLVLAGCNSDEPTDVIEGEEVVVEGRVTRDGEPVDDHWVHIIFGLSFDPFSAGSGQTDENGEYRVEGVVPTEDCNTVRLSVLTQATFFVSETPLGTEVVNTCDPGTVDIVLEGGIEGGG